MTSRHGKRLNPFQHALTRPDTYIGSISNTTRETWVCREPDEVDDDQGNGPPPQEEEEVTIPKGLFELRPITYNQGLTRIFLEIMSNAIDNKWRSEKHSIPMKKIDFTLDTDEDSDTYLQLFGYSAISWDEL